jgi:hypothetical protein
MPKSTVKLIYSKGSGKPSKPSQLTGGQKKRKSSRTKQELVLEDFFHATWFCFERLWLFSPIFSRYLYYHQ